MNGNIQLDNFMSRIITTIVTMMFTETIKQKMQVHNYVCTLLKHIAVVYNYVCIT